jgi:hypothetical protein
MVQGMCASKQVNVPASVAQLTYVPADPSTMQILLQLLAAMTMDLFFAASRLAAPCCLFAYKPRTLLTAIAVDGHSCCLPVNSAMR